MTPQTHPDVTARGPDPQIESAPISGTLPSRSGLDSSEAARRPRSWWVFVLTFAVLASSTAALLLPLAPIAIGLVAIVQMLTLIFLRMPVSLAMIIPSLMGMYALVGSSLVTNMLSTSAYETVSTWEYSVIPMFILMGLLLWRAGFTASLYIAGRQWLGWLPGGLAVGTNVAGAGLASVSGSTIGTTYALARSGIPEMLKAGYDKRLAIGSVIVAGLPGQLIPPSIMMVVYATIAEVPIGTQLLAGIGPGVLVAVMFTAMIVIFARRWAPASDDVTEAAAWSDRFASLLKIWPVPVLVLVTIVGIFSGTFTATEAGAVASMVSLVIVLLWTRGRRTFRVIADAAVATVSSVGAIFLMLVGVELLSQMFVLTGISDGFAGLIESMGLGRIAFLLVMMGVYIVLGTFMEPLPMLMLTIPILMPTLVDLEISLLWYGAFAVLMGELAIVTPPVGILSFIIHGITKEPEVNQGQDISLNDIYTACWWFIPMAVLVTVILIFFPDIATWLPSHAAGGAP